jgi:hypothetical protein
MRFAACIGFEIFSALLVVGDGDQHVQVGAVGRKGERHAGAALFLIYAG